MIPCKARSDRAWYSWGGNEFGTDSFYFVLVVPEEPRLSVEGDQSSDIECGLGADIRLTCTYTFTSTMQAPTLYWYKNSGEMQISGEDMDTASSQNTPVGGFFDNKQKLY